MSSTPPPDMWMPVYMGDFLSSTMHLTNEEKWGYLLICWAYWKAGHKKERLKSCKKNLKIISNITNANKLEKILTFFEVKEGYLYHSRIEKEIHKAIETKAKNVNKTAAATAAAAAKRNSVKASVTESVTEHVTGGVADNVKASVTESPSPLQKKERDLGKEERAGVNPEKNIKKSNPLPELRGENVDKNVDNFSKILQKQKVDYGFFKNKGLDYDFFLDLTPEQVQEERRAAPSWDKHALRKQFFEYVHQPGQEVPKYPAAAYLKWLWAVKKGIPA